MYPQVTIVIITISTCLIVATGSTCPNGQRSCIKIETLFRNDSFWCNTTRWLLHWCTYNRAVQSCCPSTDPCDLYSSVGGPTVDCQYYQISTDVWYKFPMAHQLSETCDPSAKCGSYGRVFLNGNHTTELELGQVKRLLCINDGSHCCAHSRPVELKKCVQSSTNQQEFFIYKFININGCPDTYCIRDKQTCSGDEIYMKMTGACTGYHPQVEDVILKGPIAPQDYIRGTFKFQCEVKYPQVIVDDQARFEVMWLFDNVHDPKVNETTLLPMDLTGTIDESSFKSHAGKKVSCGVKPYWVGSAYIGPVTLSSSSYLVGIKASIPDYQITGRDIDVPLKLESTVPITGHGCESLSNMDFCMFIFRTNLNPFGYNLGHLSAEQCNAKFTPGVNTTTILISMGVEGKNVKIALQNAEIHFDKYETMQLRNSIWNGYTIPPISVRLVNPDGIGICSSVTDPHYTTFDGTYYHIYEPGNYLLVKTHSGRHFEVHSHLRKCQLNPNVACNCGVAVREGNVILGVDNCKFLRSGFRTFKKVLSGGTDTGGTLTRNEAGTKINVTMPSGARVEASNDNYWHLNVKVYLPSEDKEKTEGLCGSWDDVPENDLKIRNTQQYDTLLPDRLPTQFTESYRLPPYQSFFDGTPECENTTIYRTNFCTCSSEVLNCTAKEAGGFFDVLVEDVCDLSPQQGTGRKKRKINPLQAFLKQFEDLQPDDNHTIFRLPTWPTASGTTKAQAEEQCISEMKKSPVFSRCKGFKNFDLNVTLEQCVEDILMADNLKVAESVLDVFQGACIDAVKKNVIIGYSNETSNSSEFLNSIMSEVCINQCSGQGTCVNSTCQCFSGYFGADCSVPLGKVPVVSEIRDSGICDINNGLCDQVVVTADVVTNSIKCRWKRYGEFNSSVFFTTSSILSTEKALCKTPFIDYGAINQLYLSIAVDGQSFSQESKVIIYRSQCVSCNSLGICTVQHGMCLLNGNCYAGPVCQQSTSTTGIITSTTQHIGLFDSQAGTTGQYANIVSIILPVALAIALFGSVAAVLSVVYYIKAKNKSKRSVSSISMSSAKHVTTIEDMNYHTITFAVAPSSTHYNFDKQRPKTGIKRNNLLNPLSKPEY